MSNLTTVSENGQIEINWTALEMTEEQIKYCQYAINPLIENGHELVDVERTSASIEFYLKDERYFDDELIYGVYTTVTYSMDVDRISFATFGKTDMEKFGYVKEGK